MKRFLLPGLLVMSMLLNIGLTLWIIHSLLNYTQYCYEGNASFHYVIAQNDANTQQVTGPYTITCSDSPLPQTP